MCNTTENFLKFLHVISLMDFTFTFLSLSVWVPSLRGKICQISKTNENYKTILKELLIVIIIDNDFELVVNSAFFVTVEDCSSDALFVN